MLYADETWALTERLEQLLATIVLIIEYLDAFNSKMEKVRKRCGVENLKHTGVH